MDRALKRFLADQPKVVVDLDGTLAQYTKWTDWDDIEAPTPGAKQAVQLIKMLGWKVMVFTCRDKQTTRLWLAFHGFPKLPVNTPPPGWNPPGQKSPKPFADMYIDDRSWPYCGHIISAIPDPARTDKNMTAKAWMELIKHMELHPKTKRVTSSQYIPTKGYLVELRGRQERIQGKPASIFKTYKWRLPWW